MTPIIINNVEVIEINPQMKSFSVLVHVLTSPNKMYNPEVQDLVKNSVAMATKYLLAEGFLPDSLKENHEWQIKIAGVCHPSSP